MQKNFPELDIAYDVWGHLNATRLCQSAGKNVKDYFKLSSTKELITHICKLHGISRDAVTYTFKSGPTDQIGTWVHPDMVNHLLWWCSLRFEVSSTLVTIR